MRKLTTIACALPLMFLAADAHATSIDFGGNTYFLTATAENWDQAEAEAVAAGGHLASIHNSADDELLANTFLTGAPLWIGLADPDQNSIFTWTDGSALDFTDWHSGEPNDANGSEHYTALGWHYSQGSSSDMGDWNDTPLAGSSGYGGGTDGPYFGIIEVADAPEPASLGLGVFGFAALGFGALKRRYANR